MIRWFSCQVSEQIIESSHVTDYLHKTRYCKSNAPSTWNQNVFQNSESQGEFVAESEHVHRTGLVHAVTEKRNLKCELHRSFTQMLYGLKTLPEYSFALKRTTIWMLVDDHNFLTSISNKMVEPSFSHHYCSFGALTTCIWCDHLLPLFWCSMDLLQCWTCPRMNHEFCDISPRTESSLDRFILRRAISFSSVPLAVLRLLMLSYLPYFVDVQSRLQTRMSFTMHHLQHSLDTYLSDRDDK